MLRAEAGQVYRVRSGYRPYTSVHAHIHIRLTACSARVGTVPRAVCSITHSTLARLGYGHSHLREADAAYGTIYNRTRSGRESSHFVINRYSHPMSSRHCGGGGSALDANVRCRFSPLCRTLCLVHSPTLAALLTRTPRCQKSGSYPRFLYAASKASK